MQLTHNHLEIAKPLYIKEKFSKSTNTQTLQS